MKKLFLLILSCVAIFTASATTWKLNGTSYTVDVTSTSSLGAGTTVTKAHVYTSSHHMRIFYTVTDLTNPDVAIKAVPGGSYLTSRSTVSSMAGKITGATAIAGVNGGFFSTETPGGFTVIDGKARKGFSGDGYYAITADENSVPTIGYTNKITCWCSNVNGIEGWSNGAAINSTPSYVADCGIGEMLIFYTPEYGSSSLTSGYGGYAVKLTPVNGATLTPGKYVKYTVASTPSSGNVSIPSNGIVLFGRGTQNGAYVGGLKAGQEITVYLNPTIKDNNGVETNPIVHQALGGSAMILCDGVTISSYPNSLGAISSNQPRTAVGYNADKTKLVMCVVDGRNSTYTQGCTGKVLGDIMKNLGCSDALNFDGGGSSQFWTCTEGIINDPVNNNSGGATRSVADGFFIVKLPTPVLTTGASSLSFTTSDNAAVSKTLSISGSNLRDNIKISLSGSNASQFSISASSISKDAASGTITVKYSPTATGSHSATLTISSTSATSKTVALSGSNTTTAEPPKDPTTEGPTLTLDWSYNSSVIPSTPGDARWAAGYNGTLYIQDRTNAKIIAVNKSGKSEINTGVSGFCLTADEVGNLIISTSAGGSTASTAYKILPSGKTSASDLVDLTITPPDGCASARMDIMGRAIGDVMSSSGGAFYTLASGETKISKIYVENGSQVASKSAAIALGKDATGGTQGIVQPTNNDVTAVNNVVWSDRSAAKQLNKLDGTAYTEYSFNSAGVVNSTAGGDIVTLGDVVYTIEPSGTHYSDGFVIVDRTNDKVIYTRNETSALESTLYVTCAYVAFEKIDESTANVYHFAPSIVASKYTFKTDVASGVENVIVDNETNINISLIDGKINVSGIEAKSTSIYSINGALVGQATGNVIEAEHLNGLYIVVVTDNAGRTYTKKVIVR